MNRTHTLPRRQVRELEAELLSERRRLERLMDAEPYPNGAASTDGDAVDVMVASGVSSVVQTRTHARYDAIVNALHRIATGEYGTCLGCERPIPYGRLIVMPEALHCVACGARA
jgi:DnaK suppressor protein